MLSCCLPGKGPCRWGTGTRWCRGTRGRPWRHTAETWWPRAPCTSGSRTAWPPSPRPAGTGRTRSRRSWARCRRGEGCGSCRCGPAGCSGAWGLCARSPCCSSQPWLRLQTEIIDLFTFLHNCIPIFTELPEESLDCVLAEGALGIEIVCKVSPIAILKWLIVLMFIFLMICHIMSAARVRVDLTARLLLCGAVTSPVHWPRPELPNCLGLKDDTNCQYGPAIASIYKPQRELIVSKISKEEKIK